MPKSDSKTAPMRVIGLRLSSELYNELVALQAKLDEETISAAIRRALRDRLRAEGLHPLPKGSK